jgi:hypothetical protein
MSDEPGLVFLCEVSLNTTSPQAIGETSHGNRVIVPVRGGSFAGTYLRGTVLAGSDAILQRPDGVRELDARMTWQTDDGALLYVTYQGYRAKLPEAPPPWLAEELADEYYHVIILHFETSAPQYDWLQWAHVIGKGSLMQGGVTYHVSATR